MNLNFELAVFDMAGTTVDEDNIVYKALTKILIEFGIETTLEEVLLIGAGKDKKTAIVDIIVKHNKAIPDKHLVDQLFDHFKTSLVNSYDQHTIKSFDGLILFFERLRSNGIKVILNTGYDRKIAELLLKKLGWAVGVNIDGLITIDDVSKGRPAPDMILKAMAVSDVSDSTKVIKAGDSVVDIQEGFSAKCGLVVGVLTGAQTKDQLKQASPHLILDKLTDLEAVLFQ